MNPHGSLKSWCVALFVLFPLPAHSDTFVFAIGEWPPFISKEAPDLGLHTRKVTQVFQSAGHKLEFEFLPWRRSLEMTKRGSLAATFSWSYVEERTKEFLYPETPIDRVNDVYFYRKDRFPGGLEALSFDQLKERKLTVVGIEDYWYQAPLEATSVTFQSVATEDQAWTMLKHGRADIYIENDIVGMVHSQELLGADAAQITMSEPIRTVPLYILFSRVHPDGRRMLKIWEESSVSHAESSEGTAIQ